MPASTQFAYQLVFTKSNPCQRAHKLHLYMSWTKPLNTCEATSCISTCIDQTQHLPAKTQNAPQIHQTPPMKARTQNVTQRVLTKHFPCQRGHKMYLNSSWPSPSNVGVDTKCISTCVHQRKQNFISTSVEQSQPMPVITQYAYQLVFTKSNTCQLAHKLHLILSWTKTLIASGAKHCTSTCFE